MAAELHLAEEPSRAFFSSALEGLIDIVIANENCTRHPLQ